MSDSAIVDAANHPHCCVFCTVALVLESHHITARSPNMMGVIMRKIVRLIDRNSRYINRILNVIEVCKSLKAALQVCHLTVRSR
jgi:hypothetical protein